MSLVLRDIRHSYGAGLVVDGASLDAAPGEIVCLFGPSGCGKTTLLRIAAGLERLQEGAVELDGETLASVHLHTPPEKRPIGFVFQDYVLFPHLTIEKNIAFGLDHLPAEERSQRIRSELAAVDIADFAARFPHQLSGGQQQRAALARAFARRPRAMLLDEPFASIDSALRQRLRAEMRRLLKARSTPSILVTHDPNEAIEVGDRIAVMRNGRIVETASPEALYHAPKTLAGAAIFPGSQMLPCRAVEDGVETAFGVIAPVRRAADVKYAVIHEGGVRASTDPDSACRVINCRFAGPHWLTTVAIPSDPTAQIKAFSPVAVEIGAAASASFDPALVRVLAS
jgi:iron(III) transport system ATP-binding protein